LDVLTCRGNEFLLTILCVPVHIQRKIHEEIKICCCTVKPMWGIVTPKWGLWDLPRMRMKNTWWNYVS
jgi:hypothetical protein